VVRLGTHPNFIESLNSRLNLLHIRLGRNLGILSVDLVIDVVISEVGEEAKTESGI
jgi:hypothetical protein